MRRVRISHDMRCVANRCGKEKKNADTLAKRSGIWVLPPAFSFIVLFFLLAACRPVHYPQVLLVADSLVSVCPDSAVTFLHSLRPQMAEESEAVQMYYRLLCIKAQDKAYMPHTSDSLIQAVLHYYEERADRRHLPEAYYYAGRVASDLGDAPQALDYFQ